MQEKNLPQSHSPLLNPRPAGVPDNTNMPNQTQHKPLSQTPLMRKMESKNNSLFLVVGSFLVVLLGIGTGWVLSGANAQRGGTPELSSEQQDNVTQSSTEAGLQDESIFDEETPIGVLVKGGIEGEGQYHLERDGGPSQNVYLTSTVIDLASFEGKKIQVWGNSLSGKKAGWLMDVGKVKVVE
jgi:hypothetical protein